MANTLTCLLWFLHLAVKRLQGSKGETFSNVSDIPAAAFVAHIIYGCLKDLTER